MTASHSFPLPASADDPGLQCALQPELVAGLVQQHLTEGATLLALEPDYLRWKERDGSLVGYRAIVRHAGGEHATYVTVRTATAERLEAEAGRLLHRADESHGGLRAFAFLPQANLLLLGFPIDRMMHDLRRVVRASKVRNLVAATCPEFVPEGRRFSKSRSRCELVRYKPERRAVLRWHTGFVDASGHSTGTGSLWIRSHADEQATRTQAATVAADAAGVICPKTLGVLHERLLLERHVDGATWSPFAGQSSAAIVDRVAAALARLHDGPTPRQLQTHHALAELDLALRAAEDIARLDPELGRVARELADQLSRFVPPAAAVRLSHGDLHPGQVLVSGEQVAFCDFDRACLAPPAHDLASMIAHCVELDADQTPALSTALLFAYGRHRQAPLDLELRWWTSCILLRNATRSFRRLSPNWPRATQHLLLQAARTLSGLAAEAPWR